MKGEISDLQNAENRGYNIGFTACARIRDGLTLTAFMSGIVVGIAISATIIWSL